MKREQRYTDNEKRGFICAAWTLTALADLFCLTFNEARELSNFGRPASIFSIIYIE
jgi:hypothetical protein